MARSTSVQCHRSKSCLGASHVRVTLANSKNKFVYYALKYTLILASERLSSVGSARSLRASLQHGLDIATVGDNDFYSQRAKVTRLAISR